MIHSIEQKYPLAWTNFILDQPTEGRGFSNPGFARLNDSLRTYVYILLGSQVQTRTSILDPTSGLDSRKQLAVLLESSINSPIDLPASIVRFQNLLYHASSPINYTVGIGLYMIPSDLNLDITRVKDYNDAIVIAQPGQPLGLSKINDELPGLPHRPAQRVIVGPPPNEPNEPNPKRAH